MDVAHHASYVPWLEEARIEALRAIGHPYRELEAGGLMMPVVSLQVRYRSSVRFDDEVDIKTTVRLQGPSRVGFDSRLEHDGRLVAEAEVIVACVDAAGRPRRLPAELVSAVKDG